MNSAKLITLFVLFFSNVVYGTETLLSSNPASETSYSSGIDRLSIEEFEEFVTDGRFPNLSPRTQKCLYGAAVADPHKLAIMIVYKRIELNAVTVLYRDSKYTNHIEKIIIDIVKQLPKIDMDLFKDANSTMKCNRGISFKAHDEDFMRCFKVANSTMKCNRG